MKIIVVGAGILGVSIAYSLLKRGHMVTLVDAEGVAAGATSTSYAWINSHKKHPESYHWLNFEGLKYWTNVIAEQFPEVVELNGHIEVALDKEHQVNLTDRLERLQSLDYAARWIDVEEARKATPIEIPEEALVGFFPWEGHSYPDRLTHTRVDEMHKDSAFSLLIESVISVDGDEGVVRLRSGEELSGEVVVLAAGNATAELAATAGVTIPMVPRKVGGAAFGYLAYVYAHNHRLRGPLTSDWLNLRPNGKDALILQALDLDATADPDQPVAEQIGSTMMARLNSLLPAQEARLEEVRVGYRVIPGDGLTVAGPATEDPKNRLWIAVTHSGVVLGPWMGEILAEEITYREPTSLLEEFRPARFAASIDILDYHAPRKPGDQ